MLATEANSDLTNYIVTGHPVLMVDGSQATFESVAMQLLLEANYVLAYTANRGVLPAKCKPYLSSLLKVSISEQYYAFLQAHSKQ